MPENRPTGLPRKLRALTAERRLELVLERFEAIDRCWSQESLRRRRLQELVRFLDTLPPLDVPGVSRESIHAAMDLRQWTALTVALERAIDRKRRDEDFLPVTDEPGAAPRRMPVRIVADSLRSAFNVGGLFRSGECFGIQEVILTGYSASPDQPRVVKAAMGTERNVAWRRCRRVRDAIALLREIGAQVVALETDADAEPIEDAAIDFPCGLLVGNERFGLATRDLAASDLVVRIPTYGSKHSLNVVAACSICLHELRRRFEHRGPS